MTVEAFWFLHVCSACLPSLHAVSFSASIFCSLSVLPPQSLLLNISIWVHWHDTSVPCCGWGGSDLTAEPFMSHNLVALLKSSQSWTFLLHDVKANKVTEHCCTGRNSYPTKFRDFAEALWRLHWQCKLAPVKLGSTISICNVIGVGRTEDANKLLSPFQGKLGKRSP